MSSRYALLSVSDKTGLTELAQALLAANYQLLATGGTARHLQQAGLAVTETSELTGFEQLLDGRVKSLHPTLFAGILAREGQDSLPEDAPIIDVVVVNLYPFEAELSASETDTNTLVEQIDIGGVALVRAAAKNFNRVSVICEPADYADFQARLANQTLDAAWRRLQAAIALAHTARYDSLIAQWLASPITEKTGTLPEHLELRLTQTQALRYGENPHQQAALYRTNGETSALQAISVHQGKALSYNNLLDLCAAHRLICDFASPDEPPACAIFKHTNPCGVALSSNGTLLNAWERALACDSLSAFGGIVAFNRVVDGETARAMSEMFLELVLAPSFTDEALAVLASKKNLRLVSLPLMPASGLALRPLDHATWLAQKAEPGAEFSALSDFKTRCRIVGQANLTDDDWQDMWFGWRVAAHVSSNAMIVVKNGQTLGLGIGQTSRVGALKQALAQAGDETNGAIVASDGFLPHTDNIEACMAAGIRALVQPGGSVQDDAVIAAANAAGLAMVFTGQRRFRH